MDWLGRKLKISKFGDWYKISSETFSVHGRFFTSSYGSNRWKMLESIYPEHSWSPWEFSVCSKNFQNEENFFSLLPKYFTFMEKELKIENPMDWYRIGTRQLEQVSGMSCIFGGGGIMDKLQELLNLFYPNVEWDKSLLLSREKRAEQGHLLKLVRELFPKFEILENYKSPNMVYESGRSVELDIFIPHLSLALEYQGVQHYKSSAYFGSSLVRSYRDEQKRKLCHEAGITLVEIPYFWDRSKKSLIEALQKFEIEIPKNC
eukprot:TRINITY_DN5656_c0_g1_i8.p2 TRINITY_DN5656_c0_g1~~TRINITY_DN5656_c0_g1_i8.p2  ORF type:complete len:261 (+),score=63.65 TRINITY_DN5656_c0_g1_i8:875-1657(+)